MRGRGGDDEAQHPREAGWYPDPWSADGKGERYFDGKKWGTSERPLARAATVTSLAPRRARARNGLRKYGALLAFIAAVLVVWGLPKVLHHGSNRATVVEVPGPTITLPDRPPPSAEEAASPLGAPAPVPAGNGKFEIMRYQPAAPTVPVAWDPCRPVHYVVNGAGAPRDGTRLIRTAIARLQAATGLHFVADGPTAERPSRFRAAYEPKLYPGRWAPVLIAWSNENAYPDLAGYVAGEAGPVAVPGSDTRLVYVSGQVVLDDRDLSVARLPDRGLALAIIQHELGHLAGLAHTSDRRQLMFSETEFNVRNYAQGDLRGLSLLGRQACFPGV